MSGLWAETMRSGGLVRTRGMIEHTVALADQNTKFEEDKWLIVVNIVILCFTILGASMILGSMAYNEFVKGRPGTTRTRIVQALIMCDFSLGVVGLIASSLSLAPEKGLMAHGTNACSGLGFMFIALLWTEHLWTLTLAVATFMILIYPLHSVTLWLERRWYLLWAVVCVISITIAIIGYTVYGFYPTGGICYYGDNAGLYSELIQFLPRAIVCIVISVLYAKLFVFLRRPDKIRTMQSNSSTGVAYESYSEPETSRRQSRFGSFVPGIFKRQRGSSGDILHFPTQAEVIDEQDKGTEAVEVVAKSSRRRANTDTASHHDIQMAEIPPWERIELPPFQIDGERFGGSHVSTTSSSLWGGWKGLGGRKRPSGSYTGTASAPVSPPNTSRPRFESNPSDTLSQQIGSDRATPPNKSTSRMESLPDFEASNFSSLYSPAVISHSSEPSMSPPYSASGPPSGSGSGSGSAGLNRQRASLAMTSLGEPIVGSDLSPHRNHSTGGGSSNSNEWSPRYERQRMSFPTVVEGQVSNTPPSSHPPSTVTSAHNTPRNLTFPLHPPLSPTRPRTPSSHPVSPCESPGIQDVSDAEMGGSRPPSRQGFNFRVHGEKDGGPEDEEEEDDNWDLMKMLAEPPPGGGAVDKFTPREGEQVELVQESMASYLNRKTALLMLWFPLAYIFLFSVSVIRLIYDFAGHPPRSLRAISRWLILSQGLLDAIIYGVVEWHTKRVVRKRVRKGTFSPRNSAQSGSKQGNTAAGVFRGIGSRLTGGGGMGGGTGSISGNGAGGGGFTSAIASRFSARNGGNSAVDSRFEKEEEDAEGEEEDKADSEGTTTTTVVGSSMRAGGGSASTAATTGGEGEKEKNAVRFDDEPTTMTTMSDSKQGQ
ncbi:hypothetical protein CI109_106080 [Kwoniella shandongensis]|uniref:Glucose receptor Git3-like N-terminal domain-containing protein n=1 Tax=Kwoniella shandongensis TaxID=1734106 RepID=A0A5M6BT08_9TREE|nr:uncharacterized protein CI109_006382 [Kwoniella shandongensis]KAA5525311.1 hypothetical protein CI109_006382 [Kwoniella shandongensis]